MNARSAQILTAGLAALLVVVVGATILILFVRPSAPVGPTPTPSGSGIAVGTPTFTPTPLLMPSPSISPSPTATVVPSASPSPTASPEPTPSPSPSAGPTASPTTSPSPTPTTAPTPSATPQPTIVPTSPQRQFAILNVGLDSNNFEAVSERFATFRVDGPSVIRATLSGVGGGARVRLCLFPTSQAPGPDYCGTVGNGSREEIAVDAGASEWRVSMLGVDSAPQVTLAVTFNAQAAAVELTSFRYNGTNDNAYNGFLAEIPGEDGALDLSADFEGGSFSYVVGFGPAGSVTDGQGEGSSIDESFVLAGGQPYRVSVRSPDALVDSPTSVFIHATLSWP